MVYYALSLLREFTQMIPDKVTVFCARSAREMVESIPGINKLRSVAITYPRQLFDYRDLFDVLFTPSPWGGVSMLDFPTVHALPDIQEHYFPDFFHPRDLKNRYICHRFGAQSSTLVITISQFSKSTIINKFGIPDDKIRVSDMGIHPIFHDPTNLGRRPAKFPAEKGAYLFYPANSWLHKNHRAVLEALVILKNNYHIEITTVFTGHLLEGEFNHYDIPKEICSRGLENQVYHIGTVSLSELKYLYLNATALIHPSLFEGFGIPLVEAMACGCPIIAANCTSIPEVAGEAGLYFDPEDPKDIADKIIYFLDNRGAVAKRVIIGKNLAAKFSDRRTAEQTLDVLQQAYEIVLVERGPRKLCSSEYAPSGPQPILTIISIFKKAPDSAVIERLNQIADGQNGGAAQLIVVGPGDVIQGVRPALSGAIQIIVSPTTFQDSMQQVLSNVKGEYIVFSDEVGLPETSLLNYLTIHRYGEVGAAEFLDGHAYVKDIITGSLSDKAIRPELEDDERKAVTLANLSFVVRSDAFQRVLCQSGDRLTTLAELGAALWDSTSRRRIYRIVTCRLSSSHTVFGLTLRSDRSFRRVMDRFLNILPQSFVQKLKKLYRFAWAVSSKKRN
ncbi:MAG: glycosyltransferase family 1 protein [Deltaproteobacteria bacterium]|nr:glycosyltransferase family 1 protein [Deltaproteobacteria bacterium]